MNHEEQDDLWELLGKARAPKERPFFAVKVLRAIQEEPAQGAMDSMGIVAWLRNLARRWTVALSACTAVVMAGVLTFGPHAPKVVTQNPSAGGAAGSADPLAALVTAADNSEDLVSSLDGLMATQDNAIWLADSSSPY